MSPLISIIIPTYNSEKSIQNCLDSLASQTYRNFEVLVKDGASSDGTLSICNSYKNKLNLTVLSEKDHGIYDAMNKALMHARGEWIYFLGSDDKLADPEVLSYVIKNSANHDIIYGNVFSEEFDSEYAGEFDYNKLYLQNICHQAIFLRKRVFDKIGNFDTRYKGVADYKHNMMWFLSEKFSVEYLPIVIAYYADGGFSSRHKDLRMKKFKNQLFLRFGWRTLPWVVKKRLVKKILRQYLKRAKSL